VTAKPVDEPNLNWSYLAELMEQPGELVEYWEDSLYCSADAKVLFEEYDPQQDEVELPNAYDPFETGSASSS
jgi:hypothetical protein